MRHVLTLLLILTLGAGGGLALTSAGISHRYIFGGVRIGAWTVWPRSGTESADPYTRARIARTAVLPLALGDGMSFVATQDDAGRSLDGRCTIRVSGTTPQARFWTLTLSDAADQLIPNPAGRHGFTSAEVVRHGDGAFHVVISPEAHAGHWLPSGAAQSVRLTLRLYDTPLGIGIRAGADVPLPAITMEGCP